MCKCVCACMCVCLAASELEKLQRECASLRSEKQMLQEQHQRERAGLQTECGALRSDKDQLHRKQQQLEKDLDRLGLTSPAGRRSSAANLLRLVVQ